MCIRDSSKVANVLGLNTPWTIPVIYLGFGAGLAVFLFTGYMKACPIAIEESATIDGCSPDPVRPKGRRATDP